VTRLHADNIEVERGVLTDVVSGPDSAGAVAVGNPAEGPIRFRWHHRWYAVRTVLEHWVEAGKWWQRAGRAGQSGAAACPRRDGGVVLGIDDGEREVWRVEAGWRSGSMGVYDLRFEWGTGRWSLIRVHD
jgi:hypothetical protein